jgi:hypothetical protein
LQWETSSKALLVLREWYAALDNLSDLKDKILQSASTGEIMVTNDGATILKSIALDNAAAKVRQIKLGRN